MTENQTLNAPGKEFLARLRQIRKGREDFRRTQKGTAMTREELLRQISLRGGEGVQRTDDPKCGYVGFVLKDLGAYVVCPIEDLSDEELEGLPQ